MTFTGAIQEGRTLASVILGRAIYPHASVSSPSPIG